MGCCLTNHNQHDAIIQNIIEQTVLEQEQIKIDEINSERNRTTLNSDQDLINSDDGEKKSQHHVKKSSHHKRGFEKEENNNYLRKVDYNVKLKQIVVELIKNDNSQFYKISFTASYLDFDVMVDLKGVQVNGLQHNLQIFPLTYAEAARFAKYDCFFKADKYFNIEKKDSKYIFDKLLQVERHISQGHQKSASSQEKRVVNRRWGVIANMVNMSKNQNLENRQQFKFNVVYELMEAIEVFDIEVNPRFLNIVFHLMIQSYYPTLRESLVFIEDIYFLFQDLPHLDCPQFYRILIFYQGMNYSLKELHVHLEFEQLNLSDLSLQKLAFCLFKILESCYSKYLYRLNFTLKNIYYFRRLKQFKLQSFQRISSLIPFQPNVQSSVDCVSDEKFTLFKKIFVKDYMAICDIIILFKNPRGYNQKIISQLRKKKQDKVQDYLFKDYLLYIDSIFDEDKDRAILEIIKNGCNLNAVGAEYDFEFSFKEFKRLCLQLEMLIMTAEQLKKKRKQERERRQERMKQRMEEEIEHQVTPTRKISEPSSESDEENKQQLLKDFDIEIVLDGPTRLCIMQEDKKVKDQEAELIKKELIYSSFLMNKAFTRNCQIYLRKQQEYSIFKVQALIFLAQAKSQEIANDKEKRLFFQELLEQAIELVEKNGNLSIETANFIVLVQLLQYSTRKPQSVILQLLKMFQIQQRNKFRLRRKIKKAIHSSIGLIEIRKQVILQLANVEHCLTNGQLNEANSAIFNLIDIQMKKNQANTLLFGYSLFVYGLICQETIQVQSAMITFEMCKQLYDTYFPMQKLVEVKPPKLEEQKSQKKLTYQQQIQKFEQPKEKPQFVLVNFQNMATYNLSIMAYNQGVVFCQLNDPENALKALQRAIEYRKVIHDEFSDEVIEIVLQMFKIYIENEESSQVIKLAWSYAKKINLMYKTNQHQCFQHKSFARLLFILAGIFQSCNSCFSALRFYSRANKAFTLSKTQTFNRIYFIQKQRKQILAQIKDYNPDAYQSESQETYFSTKVKSVYDKLKPFFQQVYFVNSILSMDNSLNFSIGCKLLYANGFFKNLSHDLALERYLEIHKSYQSIQKDECYGYNIEKIGLTYIESRQFEKAKQQFQFAIGIYERFLFFPFKEYCIMRCHLQIIAILAILKQTENLIKCFNQVDNFINDCQQFMNWSIILEKRKYNKFQLISKKAGIKILYQLVDLIDLIDKFRNIRKRWFKKISDTEYLAERGEKMQKRLTYRKKEKKLMGEYRKWCLTGKEIKIRIKKQDQSSYGDINKNELIDQSDVEVGEKLQNAEPPRKSKFFLIQIDEAKLKKQKKMKEEIESKGTQEIETLTKFKVNDIACSTIETQVTQNAKKDQKQKIKSKSQTPSLRSKSTQKKPINPFQKVSKKQM